MRTMSTALGAACLAAVVLCLPLRLQAGAPEGDLARTILGASGIRGGLVVHLGCGDGAFTVALRASDSYLVHGLDADAANVAKARDRIEKAGLTGKVSVEQWSGARLPYAGNLVNLLVAEDLGKVPMAEVVRVLVPRGVAYVKSGGEWKIAEKPWPKSIDEWGHYLHDATGNAVAKDSEVGPPKHMRWVCEPLYGRSHEIDNTVAAIVSARGRLFYILDEGLTGITAEALPETWAVVARDAFNGIELWRRPLPDWGWPQWKKDALAGKDWTGLRGQRTRSPASIPRRLVADGSRVFVTLGFRAPLSILDAATGEVLETCEGTEGADEILVSGDTAVVYVPNRGADAATRRGGQPAPGALMALDAMTGQVRWEKPVGRIVPLCAAIGGGHVVYQSGSEVAALALGTGEKAWSTKLQRPKAKPEPKGKKKRRGGGGGTLVARDDVVLVLALGRLFALSPTDGKELWNAPGSGGPGVANPPDLFVAGGLVWAGSSRQGRDLKTGKVLRTLELQKVITQGHHFRCYRSKATEEYLLWPKRGVEFLDLDGADHMRHDWLRAPCKYGVLPANGLLYVPSNQCFCYPGVKLTGFNALAARATDGPAGERLQRGPAFGQIGNRQSAIGNPDDWPMHRHDSRHSGSTKAAVPAKVERLWQAELGGRLSQPVVVGDRLYVAQADAHRVVCLNAADGKPVWSFTAGGRVDSSPTIHRGLALFGSRDGWVYALRASDGALAWRFRAAPTERRVMAFGQLESAWPVPGTVLVLGGVAYVSAGRSSYLDGGIRVHGLDPATGRVVHQGRIEGPYPDVKEDPGRPFDMEGTFADVLATDGEFLYMQQVQLDKSLKQIEAPRITKMGDRKVGRHVFSTAGLLNGAYWNRTFMTCCERWPGFYIANQAPKTGQLLVVVDDATYAVKCYTRRNRHSPMFFPGEGYILFADDNDNEPALYDGKSEAKPVKWLPEVNKAIGHTLAMNAVDRDKGTGFTRVRPPRWANRIPVRVRAMALAGDTLFIAGPLDVLEEGDALAAFKGRAGAVLWAVSAKDGQKLSELALDSPPVFDGLAAAGGRLWLSTLAGKVLCLGDAK